MSYFGFLSRDTLFSVLIRIRYVDLRNLVLAKPYLGYITATKYFEACWKEYNIRLVKGLLYTSEVDLDSLKHGVTTLYDTEKNKQETQEYVCGVRNGLRQFYRETGELGSQSMYQNDLKTGLYHTWDPRGNLQLRRTLKDNKEHGLSIEYSDPIRWTEYDQGVKHGLCIVWWANGGLLCQYRYAQGKLHGLCREWDYNGNRTSTYRYIHGKQSNSSSN